MTEETNDMSKGDKNKKMPASMATHLRQFLPEGELDRFEDQLPPEFLADAEEGFNKLNNTDQLEKVISQLNHQMHQQLSHRKTHRLHHKIGDLSWSYWAIIIILLLSIAGYIVIQMILGK